MKSKIIKTAIQTAPLVLIGVLAAVYFFNYRGVTVENITDLVPESILGAIFLILLLFSLKSMSFIFPMILLEIASGAVFQNILIAVLVNAAGISLQITIPYLIGRYAESELVENILRKRKKADKLDAFRSHNAWFVSYFLRVLNILPCDLVSMFLGSVKIDFRKYYIGSMAGILPGMIAITVAGTRITDPKATAFKVVLAVEVFFALVSAVIYKNMRAKRKPAEKGDSAE